RFLDETEWSDVNLMRRLLWHGGRAVEGFAKSKRIHESGLLLTPPSHSWIDSIHEGYPTRIPKNWIEEDFDPEKPFYFFPEINAEWIRMLSFLVKIDERLKKGNNRYKQLFTNALEGFERLLLQESHPVFVRDLHGRIDGRWSSAGVVAVSLLKELLFSKDYVVDFLHGVRERLLVRRDGKVFGVVVIEGERGYRSPRDYHRGVVWPRDTPYLIDLLRWIGDKETIKEILESNLSHQMEEGFLFYNAELFSPENDRLIPVKNPVQFWSQWTDPFLYI
ncbi:MAG: glucosidase family protein, partial [Candidatus Syntropharchaeia archaeon]